MCGIVGYIGPKKATHILLNGLRRLEYRGYDSAGIAVIEEGKLKVVKRPGKVAELESAISGEMQATVGIAHTRWATHGSPSQQNAHPHVSGNIAIVHNGIVENYAELTAELTKAGYKFVSQTDSEVLAHLINKQLKTSKDLVTAVSSALKRITGTFGLAVVDSDYPGELVVARRGSPLLIGVGNDEIIVGSDATAVVEYTDRVIYLKDDEIAVCRAGEYQIYNLDNQVRRTQTQKIDLEITAIEKGGYDHFLIKEIMEQPRSVTDILRGRLDLEHGVSHLGGLNLTVPQSRSIKRFLTIGCGTAYYAGLLGKYLLERMTGIPTDVEYGSEFRYRDAALAHGTKALLISQSGETADTMASLAELKRRGVGTIGLINVVGSSLAREVDGGIYLHAGPEISVASTKAFTAQVIGQLLLGLEVARRRDMSLSQGKEIVRALRGLPAVIEEVLKLAPQVKKLAKRYAKFDNAMYLGRDSLYPVALEGSHKLKEISYVHAEAYPAGEMKHGANALIDQDLMVVFLAPQTGLYTKAKSNLEEVRARRGIVLAVATEGDKEITKHATDVIYVPKVSEWVLPIVVNIPLQLLAYYVAVERGTNIDQPRNLAKSVTVE